MNGNSFLIQYEHFVYIVISFGVTQGPTVFMRLMHDIFRELLDSFMMIYIGRHLGIFIVAQGPLDSHTNSTTVLARESFFVKCKSASSHRPVDFLGHWISADSINMDPEKNEAL